VIGHEDPCIDVILSLRHFERDVRGTVFVLIIPEDGPLFIPRTMMWCSAPGTSRRAWRGMIRFYWKRILMSRGKASMETRFPKLSNFPQRNGCNNMPWLFPYLPEIAHKALDSLSLRLRHRTRVKYRALSTPNEFPRILQRIGRGPRN
jgi:hypothetical protein